MSAYLFVVVVTLGFAPGLFWLWYFLKRDKFDPEPLELVRNSFLLGMAAVFPAAVLEGMFQVKSFWVVVAAAPIVEELCKFYAVYWFIYRKADFDEPMDGIIYAAATALGFASVENVFYLLSSIKDGTVPLVAVARAFLSVPGHALFSIMWGFALGMAKCGAISYPRRRITLQRDLSILGL
jgi:protease PrsW